MFLFALFQLDRIENNNNFPVFFCFFFWRTFFKMEEEYLFRLWHFISFLRPEWCPFFDVHFEKLSNKENSTKTKIVWQIWWSSKLVGKVSFNSNVFLSPLFDYLNLIKFKNVIFVFERCFAISNKQNFNGKFNDHHHRKSFTTKGCFNCFKIFF